MDKSKKVSVILTVTILLLFFIAGIIALQGSEEDSGYKFYISKSGISPNTTINPTSLNGYNFVVDNGIYKAYFKNNSNSASAIRFIKEGYTIDYDLSGGGLNWIGKPGQPASTTTLGGGVSSNTLDNQISISENKVTYPLAYGNTNVTYDILDDRIKQTFILSGLPSIKAYDELRYEGHIYFNSSLKICANGICYNPSGTQDTFFTNGTVEFKDLNNKTIVYFDLPVVYDSGGNRIKGRYKIFGSNAQMGYEFRIPTTFLNNSIYPILADPTTVAPSESKVIYETEIYNITSTLKRLENLSFIIAPQDIFINATDETRLKFGATDYSPINSTEGALNLYMYEWNSTIEINYDGTNYYILEESLLDKINQFFGIYKEEKKIINTSDICLNSYSNCVFKLSEDKKFLNVTFFGKTEGGFVYIDPTYNYVINSATSTDIVFTNRTEASNLGLRLQSNASAVYPSGFYNVTAGDFKSLIFYNSSSQYWNITLSTADTTSRSGLVNADNSINLSNPNLVSYWALDGNYLDSKGNNHGTPIGTNNATGLSSSAMSFDGIDDVVNMTVTFTSAGLNSTSLWLLSQGSSNWQNVIFNGTAYFVNGVLGNVANYGLNISNNIVSIGINRTGSAFFNGTIDEVLIYNTSLTSNQVQQIYKSGLSQHANTNITLQYRTANTYNISDPSLIALWAFNNDSALGENGTLFVDSTGKYNGSCSGTACPIFILNGTVGSGINYVSSNDLINLTDSGITGAIGANFTLTGWINVNSVASGRRFISARNTTSTFFDSFINTDGSLRIYNGATSTYTAANTISLGRWYHVAFVASGSTPKIYLNGANQSLTNPTNAFTPKNIPLYIGTFIGDTSRFAGWMDEVRIYNRSLSASEIQNLYELGSYHISDWSSWSSETIVQDNLGKLSSSQGKFYQFKNNLYSNTTEVSPYISYYNISGQGVSDSIYPTFSNYYDNYNNLTNSGVGLFNVTVDNTNGTVWLTINGTDVYANNLSSNVYNVSYTFTNNGTYTYIWKAYGNGTTHNLNTSTRSFIVYGAEVKLNSPINNSLLDRQVNATLNITVNSNNGNLWNVTFFNSTNPLVNSTLQVFNNVAAGTELTVNLINLLAGEVFKWFVSMTDGVITVISGVFQFTPNDEPKILNLRVSTINSTVWYAEWNNEPNMQWFSGRLGSTIMEVRRLSGTSSNWSVTTLVPDTQYDFEYQVGDNLTAMSDYHNFTFRTWGWNPNLINFTYRRLMTINSTVVGSDQSNYAVNITLTEDNFKYFDSDNWVWYPSFKKLNYTNGNDLRFYDYYNYKSLKYNITYWNVPGEGGVSYTTVPDEYNSTGTWTDYSNAHDGNWNTDAIPNPSGEDFFNYTIPAGAKNNSQIRIYAGSWGRDLTVPENCFGGTKLRFKATANTSTNNVDVVCQDNNDNTWLEVWNNSGASKLLYETMMTWNYDCEAHITVLAEHWDDSSQSNSPGVDGDYDAKMWMYYGDVNASKGSQTTGESGIINNAVYFDTELIYSVGAPVISNINDTKGRTATGTNVSWSVDQAVDNRLRYATNQWFLDSTWAVSLINRTESFWGQSGNIVQNIQLDVLTSDFINNLSVVCSNLSYNNNYSVNTSGTIVELDIPDLNTNENLNWNITYTENKTRYRNINVADFQIEGLTTNTQYWYEINAYGSTANSTSTGTFILGTPASVPSAVFYNYSENRNSKTADICFNITDLNGNANVAFSVQYWNSTAIIFSETSATAGAVLGVYCKTINVNYDTWSYRAKIAGTTTGYSEAYENEFMQPQEFFAGSYVTDDDDNLDRQYCPPTADGTVNTTATCYEQRGYKEGLNRIEDWIYIETNITGYSTPYHIIWYNGSSWSDNSMSVGTDFSYLQINNLNSNYQTFYIEDNTGILFLNWTKPSSIHQLTKNRVDEQKYVAFNGTSTMQLFNYTKFYFRPLPFPNTTAFRYAQNKSNLFDAMSVQYWGTFGVDASITGTKYDRGQTPRGAIWNGEPFDTGVLDSNLPISRNASYIQTGYDDTNTTEARFCYAFTNSYHNVSMYPTNNITNYYFRFWQEKQHWSDYLDVTQDVTWDFAGLFKWGYDNYTLTRDWLVQEDTKTNSSQVLFVLNASNQTFGSIYNQRLAVGYKSGFNFDAQGYDIAETGFQTDGQWNNMITGSHQRALLIYNLPSNETLNSTDTDSDGLTDYAELFTYYTDPFYNDTDEGGALDGQEIILGYNPNIFTDDDITAPTYTLINPPNNSYQPQTINFSINITDDISGIKNATLNIYNSTGLINSTVIEIIGAPLQKALGIVVTLIDGIYTWFYNVFDNFNNNLITSNYTVNVDTIYPGVVLNSPTNNTHTANYSNNFTANLTDNLGIKLITITITNSTQIINETSWSYSSMGTTEVFKGINITLPEGEYNWNYYVEDFAGNQNTSETYVLDIDNSAPIVSVYLNPSQAQYGYDYVNFTWSATDRNLETAYVNLYNSTNSLLLTKNTTQNLYLSPGFFIPDDYTFIVFANDTLGNNITTSSSLAVLTVADTKAPDLTLISPLSGTSYVQSTVSINLTFLAYDLGNLSSSWWSYNGGLINQTAEVINNQTMTSIIRWDQVAGTTENYNLMLCVNDTRNNQNCTNTALTIQIIQDQGIRDPPGGGGGTIGGVTPVFNSTTNRTTLDKVNVTKYIPPIPPIVKSAMSLIDWIAYKLSPSNHMLGIAYFWGIVVVGLGAYIFFVFIKPRYKIKFKTGGETW